MDVHDGLKRRSRFVSIKNEEGTETYARARFVCTKDQRRPKWMHSCEVMSSVSRDIIVDMNHHAIVRTDAG